MMRHFILTIALLLPLSLMAQNRDVESLFKELSGKEGYTTVDLSTDFIKMMAGAGDDEKATDIANNITSLKVISCDDSTLTTDFVKRMDRLVERIKFKQITSINDNGERIRIFANSKGDSVTDFLLTVYGKSDNVLIYISGKNLNFNRISKMLPIKREIAE